MTHQRIDFALLTSLRAALPALQTSTPPSTPLSTLHQAVSNLPHSAISRQLLQIPPRRRFTILNHLPPPLHLPYLNLSLLHPLPKSSSVLHIRHILTVWKAHPLYQGDPAAQHVLQTLLSALPPTPTSTLPSRFEHSLPIARLLIASHVQITTTNRLLSSLPTTCSPPLNKTLSPSSSSPPPSLRLQAAFRSLVRHRTTASSLVAQHVTQADTLTQILIDVEGALGGVRARWEALKCEGKLMEGSAEKEGDGEEDEDEDDDDMWEDAVELNNVVRDVEEIQAEKEEEREETERQQQMGIDGYLPRAAPHPVEAYVPTESPATPNMPLSSTTSIQEPALLFGPSDLAASRNTLERPRGKGRKSTVQDRLKKALGIRKQRRKKSLLDP